MLIRIEEIKESGLVRTFEETPEDFPGLVEIGETGDAAFPAPLRVQLRAIHVQGLVEVEGRVETTVRLNCSRCLKEIEQALEIPFAITFARDLPEPSPDSEEEEGVELEAEEMDLIPFHGEEIDLRGAIEEQIIMGLPLRPLCAAACRGLCPQCGADLNLGDCGCTAPASFSKFATLKDFKVEKEKKK